jgi:hypothetical protein
MIQKITRILLPVVLILPIFSQAQVKSKDNAVQDSSIYYVSGEGTYLNLGTKNKFQLNLNGILSPGFQIRSFNKGGSTTNENQMSLNLVRLSMNVSAFNDMLIAGVKGDFTGATPLLEAWLGFKSKNKRHKITFGERQSNTNNRLALEDEKYASVMAPTINGRSNDGSIYGGLMQNFVVTTREGGIFYETFFTVKNVKIYPSASITSGTGQTINSTKTDFGLKYGGRVDVMPLGDFIKNNAFISQDIYYEPEPKLGIGIAGSYAVKATVPVAGSINNPTNIYDQDGNVANLDYRKLTADFIFKYQGFAFVGEFTDASVYGKNLFTNTTATDRLTPELASAQYAVGSGLNLQTSYVKSGWGAEFRYSLITPEFDVDKSIVQKQQWYTLGLNKYLVNYALKIGINATYIDQTGASGEKSTWISNLAIQLSF